MDIFWCRLYFKVTFFKALPENSLWFPAVIAPEPCLYDCQQIGLLLRIKHFTFRHGMPFGNTAPAAGAGGMLGNEDRVPAPWGLPAITRGVCGGKAGGNEVRRVAHDFGQAPFGKIIPFLVPKVEAGAELGVGQPRP